MKELYIMTPQGIKVPLSKYVKIQQVVSDKPFYRENKIATNYLYGDMSNRSVTYAGIDLLNDLYHYRPVVGSEEYQLDDISLFGVTYRNSKGGKIHVLLGGEWELTLEVFRDLLIAMAVAIFFIYFVLVGQFESFLLPLIIMSTIPLSIIGVFPGMSLVNFFFDEYFTATSMIGVIALAGIAVNNSIILLEYVVADLKNGRDLREALVEACMTRFRPIMLTTVTTILGSLTIVNDPVWAGLSYSIILGLGMSSVLILIIFPILMDLFY